MMLCKYEQMTKVKRDKDFMFRLTRKEWIDMRSQFVTSSSQKTESQHSMRSQFVTAYPPLIDNQFDVELELVIASQTKSNTAVTPYAFTEYGITMLSSVLKSARAVKMNIAIVRAFVALRKFTVQYNDLLEQLKELKDRVGNHDAQLNQIYEAIENLLDDKAEKKSWDERERIGFKK